MPQNLFSLRLSLFTIPHLARRDTIMRRTTCACARVWSTRMGRTKCFLRRLLGNAACPKRQPRGIKQMGKASKLIISEKSHLQKKRDTVNVGLNCCKFVELFGHLMKSLRRNEDVHTTSRDHRTLKISRSHEEYFRHIYFIRVQRFVVHASQSFVSELPAILPF